MRKYYDDDDYAEYNEADKPLRRILAPVERLRMSDWGIAAGVATFVAALAWLFAFPGLNPDSWGAAAVAAGLRPPDTLFPGLWRGVARLAFLAGPGAGMAALKFGGILFSGAVAGAAYLLIRVMIALIVRARLKFAVRRYFVQQAAAGLGALFFACSDPVWRIGQTFSPEGMLLLLSIATVGLFCSFMLNGRLSCAYPAMGLFGVLCAETPLGFVLFATCWAGYYVALNHNALVETMPLLDPVSGHLVKWKMTFFFAVGLTAGIGANCLLFGAFGGLDASNAGAGDVPLAYLVRYWDLLTGAGSALGVVLGVGICVLPFVVALKMMPHAADEERFLPYHVGAVYFTTATLAFIQLAMLSPLWFWTWSDTAQITSHYFLAMLMWFAAATVAMGLVVFAVDACCRNHRRLAVQMYADEESKEDLEKLGTGSRRGGLAVFLVFAALLAAAVVPGRRMEKARYMLGVAEDYVNEVLEECGDAEWIFTDGAFDARLELEAARRGKRLCALSMMAGNSPYDQYLRMRGTHDQEDRLALGMGAPMTLRTWMRDKPERLKKAAVQLGFELWKRNGKELPACSGLLARPEGMSEAERARGVENSRGLVDKVMKIYTMGGIDRSVGEKIKHLFLVVQWRLARLARMRAERADRAGQTETAMADVKISDELDHNNESLQTILKDMEKARTETLKQITPREGLQLALIRADFALARRYAEPILEAVPDDPSANFAMGMSYLSQGQLARAEEFLKRCLIKNPKEPAVWNNLAMIMLKLGRHEEAMTHAKKALELIPESAEVKDTIKKIEEAVKAKAEADAKAKAAGAGAAAATK